MQRERDLIRQCREGDAQAQRELYDLTVERIYRLLLRLTRNEQDAFDLSQETYLRVFTKLDDFGGRSSFATWVYRIAVNEALQFLRRENRGQSRRQATGDPAARPRASDYASDQRMDSGAEDRTIGSRGNDAIRAVHDAHAGPSYLLTIRDGGHFTFTDMFKINPAFGDGIGKGRRGGDGEPFAYTAMEPSYEIINAYTTAFCGVYLQRQPGYAAYLRTNHWPDHIEWDAKSRK